MQDGSGVAPASVMLSAYGFYDGTERDKDGRTTKGETFRMPCAVLDVCCGLIGSSRQDRSGCCLCCAVSAYSFYDGMERDKDGRTTKNKTYKVETHLTLLYTYAVIWWVFQGRT